MFLVLNMCSICQESRQEAFLKYAESGNLRGENQFDALCTRTNQADKYKNSIVPLRTDHIYYAHLGLEEESFDLGWDLVHRDVRAAVEELGTSNRR